MQWKWHHWWHHHFRLWIVMTLLGGRKHGHLAGFPLTLSLAVGEISSAKIIGRPEKPFSVGLVYQWNNTWFLYKSYWKGGFSACTIEKLTEPQIFASGQWNRHVWRSFTKIGVSLKGSEGWKTMLEDFLGAKISSGTSKMHGMEIWPYCLTISYMTFSMIL